MGDENVATERAADNRRASGTVSYTAACVTAAPRNAAGSRRYLFINIYYFFFLRPFFAALLVVVPKGYTRQPSLLPPPPADRTSNNTNDVHRQWNGKRTFSNGRNVRFGFTTARHSPPAPVGTRINNYYYIVRIPCTRLNRNNSPSTVKGQGPLEPFLNRYTICIGRLTQWVPTVVNIGACVPYHVILFRRAYVNRAPAASANEKRIELISSTR